MSEAQEQKVAQAHEAAVEANAQTEIAQIGKEVEQAAQETQEQAVKATQEQAEAAKEQLNEAKKDVETKINKATEEEAKVEAEPEQAKAGKTEGEKLSPLKRLLAKFKKLLN